MPGLNINSGKAIVISLLRSIRTGSVFPAENQVGDPVGDQNEADGKGKNQPNGFFSQNERNSEFLQRGGRRLGVDAQLLIQNPTLPLQCRGITELDYLPMAVK